MNDTEKIRIGMVVFPHLTQLDLTGPHEVLNSSPVTEIDLLWHSLEPVTAQGGLVLTPTDSFAHYDPPDALLVPGGSGGLPS